MLELSLQSTPKVQPHVAQGAQWTEHQEGGEHKHAKGSKLNTQLKGYTYFMCASRKISSPILKCILENKQQLQ